MPKKPNRAMQMQNYVPAGNGDASGEYADEETGSNIHFTNFKKPDTEKQEKLEELAGNLLVKQEVEKTKAKKAAKFEDLEMDLKEESSFDDLEKDLSIDDEFDDLLEPKDIEEDDIPTFEELVDETLDEDETKSSILNLSPELDKDKINALSDKEAKKVLKAIETVENAQKKYDKLKKNQKKYEGLWLVPATIPELIEMKGEEGVGLSILGKKDYFLQNNNDEKLALLNEVEAEYNKYLDKKHKLDKQVKKAQDLLAKYENPNNIYSQSHKDKAVWCKSMAESKKLFPSINTKGCTSKEISALEKYTGSYSAINEPLRGIKYGNYNDKKHVFIEQVKQMTAAIDKSVIDFDFWTQRGTGAINFPNTKINSNTSIEELNNLVGQTFEDQAFVSTGAAKGTGFASHNIIMNIYCPKGTKAAYVPEISHFSSENELIIQRGYSYKVTKVEKKNGIIYLDCDLQLGSDKNKYNDAQLEEIKQKYFY